MPEPTSTSSVGIVAIAVALLGPMAGEYAVILLAAMAGSLWALSRMATVTRGAGAALVARLVLASIALTGSVVWWIEKEYGVPAHQALAPAAFLISSIGDGWLKVFDAIRDRISNRASSRSSEDAK